MDVIIVVYILETVDQHFLFLSVARIQLPEEIRICSLTGGVDMFHPLANLSPTITCAHWHRSHFELDLDLNAILQSRRCCCCAFSIQTCFSIGSEFTSVLDTNKLFFSFYGMPMSS